MALFFKQAKCNEGEIRLERKCFYGKVALVMIWIP